MCLSEQHGIQLLMVVVIVTLRTYIIVNNHFINEDLLKDEWKKMNEDVLVFDWFPTISALYEVAKPIFL